MRYMNMIIRGKAITTDPTSWFKMAASPDFGRTVVADWLKEMSQRREVISITFEVWFIERGNESEGEQKLCTCANWDDAVTVCSALKAQEHMRDLGMQIGNFFKTYVQGHTRQ